MYENLLTHIRKFVPLNADDEKVLLPFLVFKTVKKKAYILKNGEICKANYFIISGCFRNFLILENGTEQIVQFGIDNWWIADYTSLGSATPSDFNIQAVEDAEIVAIDRDAQEKLFELLPQLERYFRIITQKAYAASLMRIKYIYTFSGEERYLHFARSFPGFVQRVPQYMLASYLGFTPEFLSKIRGKKTR